MMKTSDGVISTSDREGRASAVLEAMACGRAPAISDIPSRRETIPADAGLFFPSGDANAAVTGIKADLDDRSAASGWGQRARAPVRATDSSAAAAKAYAACYLRVVNHV